MKTINEMLDDPKVTVVDVRSDMEFAMGHYPGALHIPLDQIPQRMEEFRSMSHPILLYCRSGNRSGIAQLMLQQAGITEVYNAGALTDLPKITTN